MAKQLINQSQIQSTVLGIASITSDFTTSNSTATQVTGLTKAVTIPAGGRYVRVSAYAWATSNTSGSVGLYISLWDGTVGTGTQISELEIDQNTATFQVGGTCVAIVQPSAGSKTYNVGFRVSAGTGKLSAKAAAPAFLLVELL